MSYEAFPIPQLLEWQLDQANIRNLDKLRIAGLELQGMLQEVPGSDAHYKSNVVSVVRALSKVANPLLHNQQVCWEGEIIEINDDESAVKSFGYGKGYCDGIRVTELYNRQSGNEETTLVFTMRSISYIDEKQELTNDCFLAPFSWCRFDLVDDLAKDAWFAASEKLQNTPDLLTRLEEVVADGSSATDMSLLASIFDPLSPDYRRVCLDYVNSIMAFNDQEVHIYADEFYSAFNEGVFEAHQTQGTPVIGLSRQICLVDTRCFDGIESESTVLCWAVESTLSGERTGIFIIPATNIDHYEIIKHNVTIDGKIER